MCSFVQNLSRQVGSDLYSKYLARNRIRQYLHTLTSEYFLK